MVIPFQFEKLGKLLPNEFGWRLILVWPFGETNAAVTRVAHKAEQIREILSLAVTVGERGTRRNL
jgi:hypothetical protein